jgi:hypothetical protein
MFVVGEVSIFLNVPYSISTLRLCTFVRCLFYSV